MFLLATEAGKMGPSYPLGIAHFDPAQVINCVEWIERGWSRIKQPKTAKKNRTLNTSREFIFLNILFDFFPGSIHSYHVEILLLYNRYFIDWACSVKVAGY